MNFLTVQSNKKNTGTGLMISKAAHNNNYYNNNKGKKKKCDFSSQPIYFIKIKKKIVKKSNNV